MKNIIPLVFIIAIFVAGCDQLKISPGVTPTSTAVIAIQPTSIPNVPAVTNLSINNFPNKILMGEDENYSVYLLNPSSPDIQYGTGEIIIYDKSKNLVIQINGTFNLIVGGTIVAEDGKGDYVFLSPGTYTSRRAIVVSLVDKKQAVDEFCTSSGEGGDHLFWNDFIIFNNCDTYSNRPWGDGEAPSVAAINLKTGALTVIAKSDLTHQYFVKMVEGNNLQFLETSSDNAEDWLNLDNQKTVIKTYDLLSLDNSK
jgi:hypothetical protein